MAKQKYPEVTAGALVFNEDDKVLLVKSKKWSDKYVLIGGHIESGEMIEDALRREIKEETKLDVYDIEFLNIQEAIYDPVFHEKKHFIFLDFWCRTKQKKVTLNDEAQEYGWYSIDEAMKLDLEPYPRKSLEAYMEL